MRRVMMKIALLSALSAAMLTMTAAATVVGSAVVTADSLRMRSEANTDCATVTYLTEGTSVQVYEVRNGDYFLSSLSLIFGSIAVFLLGVELCVDRWLTGAWSPGWSIVVLVIAAALCAPLQVVRRVPSLREEVRKLFHL